MAETPTYLCWRSPCGRWHDFASVPQLGDALCFTFAVTGAALLRPDGALAGICFAPALLIGLRRRKSGGDEFRFED